MKKLIYVGPHDAVDVPLSETEVVTIAQGQESPPLPEPVADGLLEQESNWQEARPPRQKEDK